MVIWRALEWNLVPRFLHLVLEWLALKTKSPYAGAATTSFPSCIIPCMARSRGRPSPLASQTQPTAAANRSCSPEHSEDGCSWCDGRRLVPGTRPLPRPTSGKPMTETVTPLTHAHQCPLAPLSHGVSGKRPHNPQRVLVAPFPATPLGTRVHLLPQ